MRYAFIASREKTHWNSVWLPTEGAMRTNADFSMKTTATTPTTTPALAMTLAAPADDDRWRETRKKKTKEIKAKKFSTPALDINGPYQMPFRDDELTEIPR